MLDSSNDILIKNWDDLQQRLFENSFDSGLKRYRSPYVFRGMSNEKYELETSLIRLKNNISVMEKHLFRNFKKYAPKDSVTENNDWLWLTVGQHHGLPTRLLDWTFSPYIALHFMSEDIGTYKEHGVIWCVDFCKTCNYLPTALKDALNDEQAKAFDIGILTSVTPSF